MFDIFSPQMPNLSVHVVRLDVAAHFLRWRPWLRRRRLKRCGGRRLSAGKVFLQATFPVLFISSKTLAYVTCPLITLRTKLITFTLYCIEKLPPLQPPGHLCVAVAYPSSASVSHLSDSELCKVGNINAPMSRWLRGRGSVFDSTVKTNPHFE